MREYILCQLIKTLKDSIWDLEVTMADNEVDSRKERFIQKIADYEEAINFLKDVYQEEIL